MAPEPQILEVTYLKECNLLSGKTSFLQRERATLFIKLCGFFVVVVGGGGDGV